MKKIRMLSLFSGIGAFEKALKNLQIPYDLVNFSEKDDYAVTSYCLLHDISSEKNLGDITKIVEEDIPEVELLTYGFPCQPFSIAGKKQGFKDYLGRGLMFFESLRIIKAARPKICIAENVKNLKNFTKEFSFMLGELEKLGYANKVMEVNSKDYGSPQNRERVFIISVLDKELLTDYKMAKRSETLSDLILPRENISNKYLLPDDYFNEKIEKTDFCLIEDFYKNRPLRYYVDYSPALRATRYGLKIVQNGKIRKLTPEEGFYIMGYDKQDYLKVRGNLSDTQLWKQLGNSIDVKIAEQIFKSINFEVIK